MAGFTMAVCAHGRCGELCRVCGCVAGALWPVWPRTCGVHDGRCGRVWLCACGRCGRVREKKRGGPVAGPPLLWCAGGGVLLSHTLAGAVPSALAVLASGFGKGKVRACPCRCGRRHACRARSCARPRWWAGVGFGYRIADACRFDLPPGGLTGLGGWLCWVGRPISAGRLHSLAGRPRPVYQPRRLRGAFPPRGWRRTRLEAGFPLRCFQRLSLPNVANQPCSWRNNWHTRGSSVPVLSYWGQPFSILLRAQRIGTELSHDVLNPARVPL